MYYGGGQVHQQPRPPVPTVEAMGLIMMPLFISDVIQSLADLTSVAT